MIQLKQSGDTIVEVLIAMVVITTVMTGAFVSARRSTSGTRQSQERVEGLKAAEEQIERLKVFAVNDTTGSLTDTSPLKNYFCLDRLGNRREPTSGTLPALDTDTFTTADYYNSDPVPDNNCPRQPLGGVTYYTVIVRDLATNTFVTHVRWPRDSGGGNEEVILSYRLNP